MTSNLDTVYASLRHMFGTFLSSLPEIVLAIIVYILFHFAATFTRNLIRRLASEKSSHRNLSLVLGRVVPGRDHVAWSVGSR